jgi:hypothetical protein
MDVKNAISPEAQQALEKALKILEHARRKEGNEAEAEVAAQKYQAILLKYNLDEAVVEQAKGGSGKREEAKLAGGMYKFQRQLWAWAAELNFCLHFNTSEGYYAVTRPRGWDGQRYERKVWRYRWQHRLVGRSVNVQATIALATYLEEAIDRTVMDMVGDNSQRFTNYAMSMRRGMSDRLCEKMAQRRKAILAEETRVRVEAEEAAARAARAGVSTATGVTVAAYTKSERDANMDFLYGEGWSARQAQAQAEAAARLRERQEAYRRWAAANPEEARKQAEEEEREYQKRERRRRVSYGRSERDNIDRGAYYRGRDAAEHVGLDPQVGRKAPKGKIGGGS